MDSRQCFPSPSQGFLLSSLYLAERLHESFTRINNCVRPWLEGAEPELSVTSLRTVSRDPSTQPFSIVESC